jgi:NitT/TauT family transport system ATP-binding protein
MRRSAPGAERLGSPNGTSPPTGVATVSGASGQPHLATQPDGLDVRRISKTFDSGPRRVEVLSQVSLHVPRGQFATLIGPSGCGKSTLLRIVAGLLDPDSGTVSIFGEAPHRATAAKLVGFVPQSPALLPWRTVLDNVRLPLQVNRRAGVDESRAHPDPVEVLESFGLGGALHLRPRQLSGGMQQRVAIARALVFDPSILLMDEPFSALDELTRERQRHQLLDVWQSNRKTVLFVTHSVPEAVALSDLVVVMSSQPGRVQAAIPVDLPWPRDDSVETTDAFHRIEQRVRSELREAWNNRDG